jgi:signal transduction histidine kinase
MILNVDDYEPGRYARTQLLRSFGFEVREATTGSEALSLAVRERPAVVILDVNLPDMSGFEVCRRLKSQAATAAVPVLQLSATYTAAAHRAQGLDSGADAYLTEPVEPRVLLATLNALLRMKRAEEGQRELLAREQAARAQAEAANRSKEEFIAMLAHELRTPLAPIRMAMHTLRGPAERDPDVRRAVEIVERQSRHLARLLDDLLDAARLAREKIELRRAPTTVQAVVGEALEATRELCEARRHKVDVWLPSSPLWLEADPTRLAQVVGNLLTNAAKYTPPGGRIVVSAAAEGEEAVLRVRDSGIGIPAASLPRIFELFRQGDTGPARAESGLGVGLTLARMLVELHGGTLTATSDGPGCGSEFVVRLPLGTPSQLEPAAPPPTRPRPRARRIVVIEDDGDTRTVLEVALELEGHAVETAADGAEGVELALRTSPDVVLIDIALPQVDGYAVARTIRDALGSAVLLIALTGYGRADDRHRATEAGFDMHLVKPVDFDRLLGLLDGRGS